MVEAKCRCRGVYAPFIAEDRWTAAAQWWCTVRTKGWPRQEASIRYEGQAAAPVSTLHGLDGILPDRPYNGSVAVQVTGNSPPPG